MDLGGLDHTYHLLLRKYQHRGSPVVLEGRELTEEDHQWALNRGPYKSTMFRVPLLWEEFVLMVGK